MNINEGVLQTFEQTEVKYEEKKKFDNELHSLIVFKRSAKYIKYINLFLKRVIDVIGAIIGILILIPIIAIVKIFNILNKDNGPIFYSQERIGYNGKIFKMYKIRSMVVNAEEKLKEILSEDKTLKEEYDVYKKLHNDPRITKIGKILRKTSLDEFPQFLNVLKGEMSLVGPRAYMVSEKEEMGAYYDFIIKCKPGVTGLWQVSGRSNVTFLDRLEIDLSYFENHNLWIDTVILIKTFSAVFKRNGE